MNKLKDYVTLKFSKKKIFFFFGLINYLYFKEYLKHLTIQIFITLSKLKQLAHQN